MKSILISRSNALPGALHISYWLITPPLICIQQLEAWSLLSTSFLLPTQLFFTSSASATANGWDPTVFKMETENMKCHVRTQNEKNNQSALPWHCYNLITLQESKNHLLHFSKHPIWAPFKFDGILAALQHGLGYLTKVYATLEMKVKGRGLTCKTWWWAPQPA